MVGMIRRQRRLSLPALGLTLAAAVTAATLVAPTSSGAAPHRAAPHRGELTTENYSVAGLASGPRPKVAWLVGRKLHLRTGKVLSLPLPKKQSYELLGPSPQGWVVLGHNGNTARIYKVKNGKAQQFYSSGDFAALDWRLDYNGKRVIQLYVDRAGISTATVFDLAGKHRKSVNFNGYGSVAAFDGNRAILVGNKTWTWTPGSPKVAISEESAAMADLQKNIMFDGVGEGYGPTSIMAPEAPPWSAEFLPQAVSPDRKYVVGVAFNGRTLQVRKMSDGTLVRLLNAQFRLGRPLLWESPTKVVLGARNGAKYALVRCGAVSGSVCKRITPFDKQQVTVSFQTNHFGD